MARKGKYKSKQQEILDECVDAKEYFWAIYNAQKNGEEWAKDIPCDMNVYYGDRGEIGHLRGMPFDKDAKPRSREEVLEAIEKKTRKF